MDVDEGVNENGNVDASSQFRSFGISGLSEFIYDHLMSNSFTKAFKTDSNFLEQVKVGIVKFLSKLETSLSNKTNWLLVVASADTIHTVVDCAEAELKKIDDGEDKESMENLFLTFLGNEKAKEIPAEEKKSPASLRVKLRILTFFLRSATASKSFPQNIQVVFEGLFGSGNNLRLMQMAVNFGRSVAANLSGKTAMVFGPLLMNAAQRLVDEYDDEKLLCAGYRLMGDLGKFCSATIVKDVGKIQHLFDEISRESDDVSSAIQDCLVAWSDFFVDHSDASTKKILEALILAYVENKSAKCRLTALKYLEKFCSVENVDSRFALFIACGDNDEHVRKEAFRILNVSDSTPTRAYPAFDATVQFCVQKINAKKDSSLNTLPFKVDSMKQMVGYLSNSLKQTLGEQKLKTYVDQCVKERGTLENCSIYNYFRLLMDLVDSYSISELVFVTALRNLVIPCGDYFINFMKEKIDFFENLANIISKPDACSIICDLCSFCLIQTFDNEDVFVAKFRNLLSSASQSSELVLGRCLLLAYASFYAKSGVFSSSSSSKYELDFRNAQELFINRLNEREKSVANLFVACFSLSVVLKTSPIVSDDERTTELIKFLLGLVQSRKENIKIKLKETAVDLLAWICVGRQETKFFESVVEGLTKIGEVPSDIELQIMTGEAFTICCGDSKSSSSLVSPDVKLLSVDAELFVKRLSYLLDYLLNTVAKMENRHMKHALSNWLYILLDSFGSHQLVNDKLIEIQTVLLECLAETNEFTQDTSCRALAFVFQQAKDSQRDGLIHSLLEKLNSANAKEALLPYQELCSLATFIGNRQTIYTFMLLAVQRQKSNIKNLESSTTSEAAYETLEKYFDKIVPFLYRATYDPSPKVQTTMKLVWSSLQTERNNNLIQTFAGDILKYLTANLTNKSWRVRESCCLALSDFLTSPSGDLASNYLSDLWQVLFRVCDDMKESVRIASSRCILTLHKVTVKFCCPAPGYVKEKSLDAVLPILLSALESNVKEVNALSLLTLTALSKEAGSKLKPYLAVLIAALLDSLSTLEPQTVNYFAVRASGQEAEAIDQARVAASKSSPMMDSVEYCVRFVDKDVLNELMPKISAVLQSSIGLATKTGCCRLINLLCVQCSTDIKLHADKLLKSLTFHGVVDRNLTVRKHASTSVGHLVKFCSSAALTQLFKKIEAWYLDVDSGKSNQAVCAYVLRAIANENPELLRPFGSLLAPMVYMAVNNSSLENNSSDSSSDSKEIWQEVWNELGSGSDLAMKLYIDDILNFCTRLFTTSSNWDVKVRALQTLSSVAEKHCSLISDEKLGSLVSTLFAALQGRIWTGKEKILSTLCSIFEQSTPRLVSTFNEAAKTEMFEVIVKECKKTNVVYRTSAVRCAGAFCKFLQVPHGFRTLFSLLEPYLKKEKTLYDSDDETSKSSTVSATKFDEMNEFFVCSYKSLTQAIEVSSIEDATRAFAILCLNQLNSSFWKVQLPILEALNNLLQNHCCWNTVKRILNDDLDSFQECLDLKTLTSSVILTYENSSQNSIKDACVSILRVCFTVLVSCNENFDVQRLNVILNDSYCAENCPDLISVANLLRQNPR